MKASRSPRTHGTPFRKAAKVRDATQRRSHAEAELAAFAAHMEAGRHRDALLAASEACHNAPHSPRSHYAYGQAWLALGDPVTAERAFAEALRIAPTWADAWINHGLARYRQGAIDDAKSAMRQALRHVPDHPVATANLGAFMRITGEPEAAESLLRRTIEAEPDNAGARLNLVADLLQEERPADALALLDEAPVPPAGPRAPRHWHLQRSLALLQLGRAAEAALELDALTSLGPIPRDIVPLWHWRQVLLALADGDPPRARMAAVDMEAALESMGPDAVLEHRIMGRYDLAKFWSGQGEHTAAFAHWTAGHELLRPTQPFSRDEHLALIEANIGCFPAARFRDGPTTSNLDRTPVFIVGMPRSGTTLCEQILAAHAQAHGAGERAALGRLARTFGGGAAGARRIAALDASALDTAAVRYLTELHALAPDATRIVDKMPGNYLHLGLAALLLPGAKIIHCERDPRDIGLSIFTFRFHGEHGYSHDLGDLGWTIAQQERLMTHWKRVLPGRILTVKLSDWVSDFDAALARVLAHVELPHDPNCARFHETETRVRTVSRAQVRQPVNARGLGRWRTYEQELQPLIMELDRAGLLPRDA